VKINCFYEAEVKKKFFFIKIICIWRGIERDLFGKLFGEYFCIFFCLKDFIFELNFF